MKIINNIKHVAMIMDGNVRWAKKNKVSKEEGYKKGLTKINQIVDICIENKIKYLTLYALSTENLERPSVNIIFDIFKGNYKNFVDNMTEKKKVKIQVIGKRNNLPKNIQKKIFNIERQTLNNKLLNLNIAFNYGFVNELIYLINNIVNLSSNKNITVNEALINKYLYLSDIPDPDILIRTGGFSRLSNFFLFQLRYSELFFTKTLWPELSKKEILQIFNQYLKIERKYGL